MENKITTITVKIITNSCNYLQNTTLDVTTDLQEKKGSNGALTSANDSISPIQTVQRAAYHSPGQSYTCKKRNPY